MDDEISCFGLYVEFSTDVFGCGVVVGNGAIACGGVVVCSGAVGRNAEEGIDGELLDTISDGCYYC